MKLNQL